MQELFKEIPLLDYLYIPIIISFLFWIYLIIKNPPEEITSWYQVWDEVYAVWHSYEHYRQDWVRGVRSRDKYSTMYYWTIVYINENWTIYLNTNTHTIYSEQSFEYWLRKNFLTYLWEFLIQWWVVLIAIYIGHFIWITDLFLNTLFNN